MFQWKVTFRDKHIDGVFFSVGCPTGVVARVTGSGFRHRQPTVGFDTRLCGDGDTTSDGVVVDHTFVVVPEHVLRRRWTL